MANPIFEVAETEKLTLLRRRNSITHSAGDSCSSASSTTTSSSSSSFPSEDIELITTKLNPHRYTSLKELLPSAAVNSSKNSAAPSPNISIRNHLVKQAAWAYLQPMSTAPGPAGGNFFSLLWPRVASVFVFLYREVETAVHRALRALHLRRSR